MARKRKKEVTPQTLREILRLGLKHKLGYRAISRSCGVSHVTISNYLRHVESMGLTWEDVESSDEERLQEIASGVRSAYAKHSRPEPDWEYIHKELGRKGVTLQLLWEEYKEKYNKPLDEAKPQSRRQVVR